MIPKEIKDKIDEMYPLEDARKVMCHDNLGQYSRREAAKYGYSLASEEIKRLKEVVKCAYFDSLYYESWEHFKQEYKL